MQEIEANAKNIATLTASLEEERRERGRIVASLRATIQRVRASGHAEDRLQQEVLHLTQQLAAEKRSKEDAERLAATAADDLAAARGELEEVQRLHEELQAAAAAAERRHAAETLKVRTWCLLKEGMRQEQKACHARLTGCPHAKHLLRVPDSHTGKIVTSGAM